MDITYITYRMGTYECALMLDLIRDRIRAIERDKAGSIDGVMDAMETQEYDTLVDMHNDLIRIM